MRTSCRAFPPAGEVHQQHIERRIYLFLDSELLSKELPSPPTASYSESHATESCLPIVYTPHSRKKYMSHSCAKLKLMEVNCHMNLQFSRSHHINPSKSVAKFVPGPHHSLRCMNPPASDIALGWQYHETLVQTICLCPVVSELEPSHVVPR